MVLHENEQRILREPEKCSFEYSEGDQKLQKLLLTCYRNGLMTEGCCKGHESEGKLPYLSIVITDENEELLQKLFTSISVNTGFYVGVSSGSVIRDRIVLYIRSIGTEVNWDAISEQIIGLSQSNQHSPISNVCKFVFDIAKKHLSHSTGLYFNELSPDGKLYIQLSNNSLIDEMLFARSVRMERFKTNETMGTKFIPFGFVMSSNELENDDIIDKKEQLLQILDVVTNADKVIKNGHQAH